MPQGRNSLLSREAVAELRDRHGSHAPRKVAARQLALEQLFLSCHAFNRPMVRIAERAAATLDFSDCECSATIAVNKGLHPDVDSELSDVVKVLNLPRGLPVGG